MGLMGFAWIHSASADFGSGAIKHTSGLNFPSCDSFPLRRADRSSVIAAECLTFLSAADFSVWWRGRGSL